MSNGSSRASSSRGITVAGQFRWWIITIPKADWEPVLVPGTDYIKGQEEIGASGYHHWQLVCYTGRKKTFNGLKSLFPNSAHIEPTQSAGANEYVWKDDTSVPGTRFEFGSKPMRRNRLADWAEVLQGAVDGDWSKVPPDVYIRCYSNLKKIHVDNLRPVVVEKQCFVYWGRSGAGKSRRAWEEATFDAYPKDPATKWWCGYSGHRNVVLDEFRGQIGISHLLRYKS